MTIDELQTLMRDTVNSLITISDVINHHPNGPRASGEFASIHVGPLRKIGTIDKKISTNVNDLDFKTVKLYEAMISFNFFRGDALGNAAIVAGSLYDQHVTDRFSAAGAGLTRISDVRELSEVFDASHEERSQFDAFVQFELTSAVESITGIDTININGTVDNSEEIVEQITITVGG